MSGIFDESRHQIYGKHHFLWNVSVEWGSKKACAVSLTQGICFVSKEHPIISSVLCGWSYCTVLAAVYRLKEQPVNVTRNCLCVNRTHFLISEGWKKLFYSNIWDRNSCSSKRHIKIELRRSLTSVGGTWPKFICSQTRNQASLGSWDIQRHHWLFLCCRSFFVAVPLTSRGPDRFLKADIISVVKVKNMLLSICWKSPSKQKMFVGLTSCPECLEKSSYIVLIWKKNKRVMLRGSLFDAWTASASCSQVWWWVGSSC